MYLKSVEAAVCDIRSTDPDPQAEFLVDTNAWYWTTYTRASIPAVAQPKKYQSQHYARFIKKALDKGSILHRCDLSLAEMTHSIEECERRIFVEFVAGHEMTTKEYRHGEEEERKAVVSEVEAAWGQVVQMSHCIGLTIKEPITADALKDLRQHRIDGYDLFLLQAMKQGKVMSIITDDADFATVPGLEVFTCNPGLIALAKQQGHLQAP
jgi:predicted nucleic acid-binding protein